MQKAIDETNRRRKVQDDYNKAHGITPKTIKKAVRDLITISKAAEAPGAKDARDPESMSVPELEQLEKELNRKMRAAAAELNFEEAAVLRDRMAEIRKLLYDNRK